MNRILEPLRAVRRVISRHWTRAREDLQASTPASDPDEFDVRRNPRERLAAAPMNVHLPGPPFDPITCTVGEAPAEEQQAAFSAHVRACRGWEEFWERAPMADWMLDTLRGEWDMLAIAPERELRRFALRCLEGLHGLNEPPLQALLDAVSRRADGHAALGELATHQGNAHAVVVAGGLAGLPRCIPSAAGALAAWHAADRSPYEAAFWSAEFAARHDAFVALERAAATWTWPEDRGEPWRHAWRTAYFAKAHPSVRIEALTATRRRQADVLKSFLPQPFALIGPPVRREVYFGAENVVGNLPILCRRCGAERAGATPGVVFDVRRMRCASCGVAMVRLAGSSALS